MSRRNLRPVISKRKRADRNGEIYTDISGSVGTYSTDLEIFNAIQIPVNEQISVMIQSRYYWFLVERMMQNETNDIQA